MRDGQIYLSNVLYPNYFVEISDCMSDEIEREREIILNSLLEVGVIDSRTLSKRHNRHLVTSFVKTNVLYHGLASKRIVYYLDHPAEDCFYLFTKEIQYTTNLGKLVKYFV